MNALVAKTTVLVDMLPRGVRMVQEPRVEEEEGEGEGRVSDKAGVFVWRFRPRRREREIRAQTSL